MKKPERILWALSLLIAIVIVVALVKQFGSDPIIQPDPLPAATIVNNTYLKDYAGGYFVIVDGNNGYIDPN